MVYVLPVNLANDVTIIVKSYGNGGAAIIPIAGDGVVGGIKPLYTSVYGARINRSGLVIQEDGTTYINTNANRGVTRDGAGQVQINPATQAEVAEGEETYKPVTPATLAGELARRNVYSTTPVRVGTWIDGAPVWRQAFEIDFGDLSDSEYADVLKDKDILTPISVKDTSSVECWIINGYCIFASLDPALCDNMDVCPLSYSIDLSNASLPASTGRDGMGLFGWVEFATPENNLE